MSVINAIESKYKKPHIVDVKSGDTVKVHQKIREGSKERIQIFEGLVIRTGRKGSHTATITVRRIASGIGVEKTYLLHNPLVTKVEVVKRSKVRRNYLSYMRQRTGKSARLASIDFDQEEVNKIPEVEKREEPQPSQEDNPVEEKAADSNDQAEKQQDKEKPAEESSPQENQAKKEEPPKDDSPDSKK